MGIDFAFAQRLIDTRDHVCGLKRGLMLGRQQITMPPRHIRRLAKGLTKAGVTAGPEDLVQADGFAERFLQSLGYPEMQSMDASAFEACDLVHDLNDPLPDHLAQAFDVILDGGTLEHVFNTPQALDNVFHMLADGGVFISINGMTGWAGHGFYQFSPDLVWRYWQDARACQVLECAAVPTDPNMPPRDALDAGKAGGRFKGRGMEGQWYLYYVVRRVAESNPAARITNTTQGDYAARWQTHETDTEKAQ